MNPKFFLMIGIIVVTLIVIVVIGYSRDYPSRFRGPVSKDAPLPEALFTDLEKYVLRLIKQFDVPGVAMVLVQGDKVVYARGLGVSDLETQRPVTTQTLFGIGSSTKPMNNKRSGSATPRQGCPWFFADQRIAVCILDAACFTEGCSSS